MIAPILRMKAVAGKEFMHILRDWQTLMIIVAMPVVMMFLYGYALTLDLNEVKAVVEDRGMSSTSRTISQSIGGGTLLSVQAVLPVVSNVDSILHRYNARLLIRLPADLSQKIATGGTIDIGAVIDGSDPNTGTILRSAAPVLIQKAVLSAMNSTAQTPLDMRVRFLYNEEQKSALSFIPGLMAMILVMVSAMLTSLAITREKESGTLEQLLVSPLHPFEIIVGKLAPYTALAAIDGTLIMCSGAAFFQVVPRGSLFLLAGVSAIFIIASLAIGLVISTIAANQRQAMLMVLPATMLPTMILSGFIFPLTSMPWPLQAVAHILPATYYLSAIRGIILKGATFQVIASDTAALCLIALILMVIAVKKFRSQL